MRALNHTFESRDEKKAKIWSLEGGGMASSFVDLLGSTSPGIKVRPEPDAIHRHAAAERAAPEPNFDISVAKGSLRRQKDPFV